MQRAAIRFKKLTGITEADVRGELISDWQQYLAKPLVNTINKLAVARVRRCKCLVPFKTEIGEPYIFISGLRVGSESLEHLIEVLRRLEICKQDNLQCFLRLMRMPKQNQALMPRAEFRESVATVA